MSQDPGAQDALALIACELRGDKAGAVVILGECDLQEVAAYLARIATEAMRHISGHAP